LNIGELVIRKGTLTVALSVAVLILGWLALLNLPRWDFSALRIKEAWVITPYPGASAAEVEREVSDKVEKATRGLAQVQRVESHSFRGRSVVSVSIQDQHDEDALLRIWEELRHRIDDLRPKLPPGAGPSIVDTDLADFYGAYYALVGEGFSPAELKGVAELLQHELSTLDCVKKVILFGDRQETLYVEIHRAKTNALGIDIDQIFQALNSKNLPADAGHILVGPQRVSIAPSGIYRSEQDLGDLMVTAGRDRLIRLGDIAEIRRGYEDAPRRLLRVDGRIAVGIAIAAGPCRDPVALAEALKQPLAQLTPRIPLGMELKVIALQSSAVAETIDDFAGYLIQSLLILIAAILLFMGLRGGLIVVFVTLLILAGSFVAMDWLEIALDRISLGALVMTLGLIPGNVILVVHGMKLRMDKGVEGIAAARELVAQNVLPLLVATAVVILLFAPIAGMHNSTGEQIRALFFVILIAMTFSLLSAVSIAPLLTDRFLNPRTGSNGEQEPYGGRFHHIYARILRTAIRYRWAVLGMTAMLVALSLYGFGFVKQTYFSPSTGPGFLVEVYFREGTHIRETERRMDEIQAYLRSHDGVMQVASAIGGGHPRYLPFSKPAPEPGSHYGISLVMVQHHRQIDRLVSRIRADLEKRFPDAIINLKKQVPGADIAGGRIQLRIGGPDPAELRRLADRVKRQIRMDPDAKAVRDDWGAKVKVAQPVLAQALARRLRIDRPQVAAALRAASSGIHTGFYREGSELIPIVVRAPRGEHRTLDDVGDIHVTSPLRGDRVSLKRLLDRLETITEDARRVRRDGVPLITVHAEADQDSTFDLLERIKPGVEKALGADLAAYGSPDAQREFAIGFDKGSVVRDQKIALKGMPGYFIAWGGEAEGLSESRAQLWAWAPLCCGLTVLVLIALFNALRQPLIVLLTAPLSLIGIATGLLLTGRPLDFPSLLGAMGLSGVLMRNAILLVEPIDREIRAGKSRLEAILQAASSRLRPVGLASLTAVLGILPLLRDDLFLSMAITLLFGLGLASLLALVVVPVLYATLFGVRTDEREEKR
jgi:multidrug efflux pump subunit AcrB